jgi:hypothetical protein
MTPTILPTGCDTFTGGPTIPGTVTRDAYGTGVDVVDTEFRPPPLNAAQNEVLDLLGAGLAERPSFDATLRDELREMLRDGLAPIVTALPTDESLWVGKHALAAVHGCEAKLLADEDLPFAWTPSIARGVVAHKAIELGVNWRGEITPLDLVDEAVASLQGTGDKCGDWLSTCGDSQRAEVRSEANDRVAKFLECFPPLKKAWRPVTESRCRVELHDGRVVLAGKIDLSLGQAAGATAGKVLIDLKTGGFVPSHLDDLRFYALLETIRLGTPPRLLATYYLDSGQPRLEPVSEASLESAARRTVDGALRLADLRHRGAAPVKRTGAACGWCPLLATCAEGKAFVARRDGVDDDLD